MRIEQWKGTRELQAKALDAAEHVLTDLLEPALKPLQTRLGDDPVTKQPAMLLQHVKGTGGRIVALDVSVLGKSFLKIQVNSSGEGFSVSGGGVEAVYPRLSRAHIRGTSHEDAAFVISYRPGAQKLENAILVEPFVLPLLERALA